MSKMFHFVRNNASATLFPVFLQDNTLWDKSFMISGNIVTSSLQPTGVVTSGCLTQGFTKALCRAVQIELGCKDAGGYMKDRVDGNGMLCAEWIDSDNYDLFEKNPLQGERVSIAYNKDKHKWVAQRGGMALDIKSVNSAPFIFCLFGFLRFAFKEFNDKFELFCRNATKSPLVTSSDEEEMKAAAVIMANAAYYLIDCNMSGAGIEMPSQQEIGTLSVAMQKSARFMSDLNDAVGCFKLFANTDGTVKKTRKKSTIKSADFVGKFASSRELTEEEKLRVPAIGDAYVVPQWVVEDCTLLQKDSFNSILLRGEPGTGKTAGARAIAAGLGLPYASYTCNEGTEIYDLFGQMMPNDSTEAKATMALNEAMKGLPSLMDIAMDPAGAYEKVTGVAKSDATEMETMAVLVQKTAELMGTASEQGFHYVESELVKAVRYGWVFELQEPTCIKRAGVLPGLNALLDETASITLPTGEVLKRHPDFIMVATTNVDLEGCAPMNQSFLDRFLLKEDIEVPKDKEIINRVKKMTGCDDSVDLEKMVDTMNQLRGVAKNLMCEDGTISIRSLAAWVSAYEVLGDYIAAAQKTIIPSATAEKEALAQMMGVLEDKF